MCSAHRCCKIFVQRECRSDCRAKEGGHPVVTEAELMVAFLGGKLTPMAVGAAGRAAHAVLTDWLGAAVVFEWNKAHLINHLAEVHGYRHYLELCTFMSGGRYASPGNGAASAIKAYVDFISQRHDLAVYTVDADYGCGVIRKLAEPSPESATAAGAELLGDWRNKRDDPMEAFA